MAESIYERLEREGRERAAESRQKFQRDQERRADNARQDAIEKKRQLAAASALREAKRHNRAIESSSGLGSSPNNQQGQPIVRRKGGFRRLLILAIAGLVLYYFWPQIEAALPSINLTVDRPSKASSSSGGPRPDVAAEEETASPPSVKVKASEAYPVCSSTVTDHCREK